MKPPIRLLAIDIDGTLLNSQFHIPPANLEALRRAHEAETDEGARKILALMLRSALTAEDTRRHVCSDAGVPILTK